MSVDPSESPAAPRQARLMDLLEKVEVLVTEIYAFDYYSGRGRGRETLIAAAKVEEAGFWLAKLGSGT